MDRKELRFRILFEHYASLYTDGRDVHSKVAAIVADGSEKRAATAWLIDEGYIEGENRTTATGDIHPVIGRINSRGINFVESVMDGASEEVNGQGGSFDSLSKADKIKRFVAKCLSSPVAGTLCKAAQDAIAALMK